MGNKGAFVSRPGQASGNLPGAEADARFAGGTTSGAPVAGNFRKGDLVVDHSGAVWVCTVSGSPGTWTQVAGDCVLLDRQAVTGSPAASLTFSPPATYRSLVFRGVVRSDYSVSGTSTGIDVVLNGDTGANYDWSWGAANATGTTVNGSGATGDALIQFGEMPIALVAAGLASAFVAEIQEYAGTTWQKGLTGSVQMRAGATGALNQRQFGGGTWMSTAAVTSVLFRADVGNLEIGSVIAMYGLGAI